MTSLSSGAVVVGGCTYLAGSLVYVLVSALRAKDSELTVIGAFYLLLVALTIWGILKTKSAPK